jgi:hypothetical protein
MQMPVKRCPDASQLEQPDRQRDICMSDNAQGFQRLLSISHLVAVDGAWRSDGNVSPVLEVDCYLPTHHRGGDEKYVGPHPMDESHTRCVEVYKAESWSGTVPSAHPRFTTFFLALMKILLFPLLHCGLA